MPDIAFNRARFLNICYEASLAAHSRFNIGTYKEKKLHLILKSYFEPSERCREVPHGGYIADILNADGITEIQTSGFANMRDKLEAFLPDMPVTLVFPIAARKYVSWIDPESGEISRRSPSPKKGKPFDAVPEMVFIRPYLNDPHLTVRAVLLEIDEYRMLDGRRSLSRKRGSSRYERIPTDICGIYDFHGAGDFLALLPYEPGEVVTAHALADAARFRGRDVSAMTRVLQDVGAMERCGKDGNAILYRIGGDAGKNPAQLLKTDA